jgi:hypothetical protein
MMIPLFSVFLLLAVCSAESVHIPLTRRAGARTTADHFAAGDRARARYGYPKRMSARASTAGVSIVNQVSYYSICVPY